MSCSHLDSVISLPSFSITQHKPVVEIASFTPPQNISPFHPSPLVILPSIPPLVFSPCLLVLSTHPSPPSLFLLSLFFPSFTNLPLFHGFLFLFFFPTPPLPPFLSLLPSSSFPPPFLLRLSQQFYLQVSAWMIRMESEFASASGRKDLKGDINSRATLYN